VPKLRLQCREGLRRRLRVSLSKPVVASAVPLSMARTTSVRQSVSCLYRTGRWASPDFLDRFVTR
jgi:hypothetical protein